jgi:hypothetical protein
VQEASRLPYGFASRGHRDNGLMTKSVVQAMTRKPRSHRTLSHQKKGPLWMALPSFGTPPRGCLLDGGARPHDLVSRPPSEGHWSVFGVTAVSFVDAWTRCRFPEFLETTSLSSRLPRQLLSVQRRDGDGSHGLWKEVIAYVGVNDFRVVLFQRLHTGGWSGVQEASCVDSVDPS